MLTKIQGSIALLAAGAEDIEVPNLEEERMMWEDWLMEAPKVLPQTRGQAAVYAALFPKAR